MTGFGKGGKGQILYHNSILALSALGGGDVIAHSPYPIEEDFRVLKMEIFAHISLAGDVHLEDGPLLLGLSDGELAASEIEECLEAVALDANDHLNLERTHRPVWPLGYYVPGEIASAMAVFNGGRPVTWDKRWTFSDTDGWTFWIKNMSTSPLTTGASSVIFAKVYGVWVK